MTRSRKWYRGLRALLLNGALVLGSVLFAVLLAEVLVRLLAPQQLILIRPDLWQPADTVGWLRRPNVDVRINTGEGWVDVHTDQDGFRVGESGRVRQGDRVLVQGDSFMEALQVQYEESFAGLLQAELPSRLRRPVSVRNAGVGAWEPSQYLLQAKRLLPRDDYSLVVTSIFLGNDIVPQRTDYYPRRAPVERHPFRIPRSLDRRELVMSTLVPLNESLEVRSHLFILFRNNLETLRMRLGLHPLAFPPEFMVSESTSARWDVAGDLAAEIDSVAASRGTDVLFVLIPAAFQIDSVAFANYVTGYGLDPDSIDLEQPNRKVAAELERRGLRYIDALPAFRAAYDTGAVLYGSIDPHLSAAGHRVLADAVLPTITALMDPDSAPAPIPGVTVGESR